MDSIVNAAGLYSSAFAMTLFKAGKKANAEPSVWCFCSETISLHAEVTYGGADREEDVHVSWNRKKKAESIVFDRCRAAVQTWFWFSVIECQNVNGRVCTKGFLLFIYLFILIQFWLKSWHQSSTDHFISNADKHDDIKEVIWKASCCTFMHLQFFTTWTFHSVVLLCSWSHEWNFTKAGQHRFSIDLHLLLFELIWRYSFGIMCRHLVLNGNSILMLKKTQGLKL